MSDRDLDSNLPIPDEPPPAYDTLDLISSNNQPSRPNPQNQAASQGQTSSAGLSHSHSTNHPPSHSTNPFLSLSEVQSTSTQTSSSSSVVPTSSSNPSPWPQATSSSAPDLPPRTYSSGGPTLAQVPDVSSPISPTAPTGQSQSHSFDQSRINGNSQNGPPPQTPSTLSSIHSNYSYNARPPSNPSTSSSTTPHLSQPQYKPTTTPTPGQPLLRKGKLLVYPKDWPGCYKCGDTGYKRGDPSKHCHKCWDKYGRPYSAALSYSMGLNNAVKLQKPLPAVAGAAANQYPTSQSYRPPYPPASNWNQGPNQPYVPGGYPGSTGHTWAAPLPPQQATYPTPSQQPYSPYAPPPTRPPPAAAANHQSPASSLDPETIGSRMQDLPPNYNDASNVGEDERLPSQYVPPNPPPLGHAPQRPLPRPPVGYPPGPGQAPFVGGFSPHPYQPNPVAYIGHGGLPPPGALVVMPGDPRIGGRMCFECRGRGRNESLWFGDETCYQCRGTGRLF